MQERLFGAARAALSPEELEEAERAGRTLPFDAAVDEVLGEREQDLAAPSRSST